MGIKERRQRERRARKAAVLDAARELVRERGFNGATTKQIAERCELSEATLFFYFKNKDEIFTSLLFDGIDFMGEGLDAIIARNISPKRKLEEMWKFFRRVSSEQPEYFHVFAYLANPRSTASITDELRDELAKRSGDNMRRFAAIVAEAVPEGNARQIVDVIWASFLGLVLLRESRRNLGAKAHPSDRELGAALQLLIDGLARPLAE